MAINNQSVTSTLTVGSTVKSNSSARGRVSVTQTIIAAVSRTFNRGSTSDTMFFKQAIATVFVPDPRRKLITSTVGVAQAIARSHGKPGHASVGVTQTIGLNATRTRHLSDSIAFSEIVQAYLIKVGTRSHSQEMAGFVNPSVATYFAGLTPGLITLGYNTTTLQLRKPDFGDKWSYEAYRIYRTTRGLDLQVLGDPMWPTAEILDMEFSYLSETNVTNLLSFLTLTLGKRISLYDHLGRLWTGFILNPNDDIQQKGRFNYTAHLTFQGVLS